MDTTFRVSVRDLVGFTYYAPDIFPGGGMDDLLAGTQAHQARESAQSTEFETEKPIRLDVQTSGECVTLFGRMDAYADGEVPCIEEIKLCALPPTEPMPEHLAQVRLYGAMLAQQSMLELVELRVVYVNLQGEPVRIFTERAQRAFLVELLQQLLQAWLTFAIPERDRTQRRNQWIKALPFPFEAYRAGQRELAVQVYTAITRKKRLFATLPTGTGKSAAVLYPAIKALGEGKSQTVIYLTARTTARQSPLSALERMRGLGSPLRVSTLLAKEKLCPAMTRCHPDDCPRARGHFVRQREAIQHVLRLDAIWTDEIIVSVAEQFQLCPFEFALTLTELADVVLMDMNYAFDPFAQIARLFKKRKNFTLLIDEAHHVLDRVRESLSGSIDSAELRRVRALFGKALGRKHPMYPRITMLLKTMEEIELPILTTDEQTKLGRWSPDHAKVTLEPEILMNAEPEHGQVTGLAENGRSQLEGCIDVPPPEVVQAAQAVCESALLLLQSATPNAECRAEASHLIRRIAPFLYAAVHFDQRYAALLVAQGKQRVLELYCLSPAEVIAQTTKRLRGAVFFSATLSPLDAMRTLLGGDQEDACFSLPSPFPLEHLKVVRKRIQTRYAYRQASAAQVAHNIWEVVSTRKGKYIVYFPSYTYMRLVLVQLEALQVPMLLVQQSEMDEVERERFLAAFTKDALPKLGLCVLGGLFSEGVDLPGEQLVGAMIVGVGLPTPSLRLKTLQAFYQTQFGDGFLYAWMIPAMQKVSQAGGRVIRTEKDQGLVLLMDDRYYDPRYVQLLPPHWQLRNEDALAALLELEET